MVTAAVVPATVVAAMMSAVMVVPVVATVMIVVAVMAAMMMVMVMIVAVMMVVAMMMVVMTAMMVVAVVVAAVMTPALICTAGCSVLRSAGAIVFEERRILLEHQLGDGEHQGVSVIRTALAHITLRGEGDELVLEDGKAADVMHHAVLVKRRYWLGAQHLAARGGYHLHPHIRIGGADDKGDHLDTEILFGDDAIGLELLIGAHRGAAPDAPGRRAASDRPARKQPSSPPAATTMPISSAVSSSRLEAPEVGTNQTFVNTFAQLADVGISGRDADIAKEPSSRRIPAIAWTTRARGNLSF